MKNFICDICGISTTEYKLKTLYDIYKIEPTETPGVEHVCEDCDKKLVQAFKAIEDAFRPVRISWVKQIIKKMLNQKKIPE